MRVPCENELTNKIRIESISDLYVILEGIKSPNPSLEELKSLLKNGFDSCGLPQKGIIIDPSIWASFEKNKTLNPNYNPGPFECAPFNGLSLQEKIDLENWFKDQNLLCSFTYDVLDGKQLIDAITSETISNIANETK